MKMKVFYLENMGAERFKRDWDWCYAKGLGLGLGKYMYDCKVFSRGVIQYLLGYS